MKLRSASANWCGRFLALSRPDAVLAGDGAAERETGAEQLLVDLLGALELARVALVVADDGMQVPVAGVEDIGED